VGFSSETDKQKDVVWHDHVVDNPNSVLTSTEPKFNERFVDGGGSQNRATIVTAGRDEVDRMVRKQPSKALRRGHTLDPPEQEVVQPPRKRAVADRAYNLAYRRS